MFSLQGSPVPTQILRFFDILRAWEKYLPHDKILQASLPRFSRKDGRWAQALEILPSSCQGPWSQVKIDKSFQTALEVSHQIMVVV